LFQPVPCPLEENNNIGTSGMPFKATISALALIQLALILLLFFDKK